MTTPPSPSPSPSAGPTTVNVPPPASLRSDGLPTSYVFKPDWEVTPRHVKALMDEGRIGPSGDTLLLDCRRQDEYDVSRMPHTVLIPMQEVDRRVDEIETEDGGRDRQIIVHCHHGMRSMKVAATLRALGFTNVMSMAGGIELWSLDIDPSVPRYTK